MSYVIRDGLPVVQMAVNDVLDWGRDWTDELGDGETITASLWTVPEGLTAGAATQEGPITSQFVTATEAGTFNLVNRMTDSVGRVRNRTLVIEVVEAL